jgi:hypothetical protein
MTVVAVPVAGRPVLSPSQAGQAKGRPPVRAGSRAVRVSRGRPGYNLGMAALRIQVDGTVVYEGAATSVPRVGDSVRRGEETVRVESVEWDFAGTDVTVTLVLGDRPYTF